VTQNCILQPKVGSSHLDNASLTSIPGGRISLGSLVKLAVDLPGDAAGKLLEPEEFEFEFESGMSRFWDGWYG
jgi:hypothetical protein